MEKRRRKLYRKEDWFREGGNEHNAEEPYRSAPRRDYARLIHSPAFRRLQGKTQLFPSYESDFFRNRLTHSLEVAQIAKSIAVRINSNWDLFKPQSMNIDTDIVEFAGLAHDIGHPPFGHNGEAVLDRLMLNYGGFEGNAQTLRILARLEKKVTSNFPLKADIPELCDGKGTDLRLGLDLSYRTLASIVKYDSVIPATIQNREASNSDKEPVKGVYHMESGLLERVKSGLGVPASEKLFTIEASIMDVADDIAYSTYDIEDSLKAGFLSPLSMISMSDNFKGIIVEGVPGR